MTVTGLFTWLGGGRNSTITDHHERAGYVLTGIVVLLFAAISGAVVATASAAADGWPLWAAASTGLVAAALTGVLARAVATPRLGGEPDRLGSIGRVAVAILAAGVLAELAALVLFAGSVDRMVNDRAHASVDSAPAVVAAQDDLDRALDDRTTIERSVAAAQADVDRGLVIARCEYNPTPDCPQTRITGVPGRGPETQTANDMLDDARRQLSAARARLDAADRRIADERSAQAATRAAAFAEADRGLGARWRAMNDYTMREAMLLRVLTIAVFVALALLPLALRWWRGESSFDRVNAARATTDRAERDAETAIAVTQARVRSEAETLRAEQQLAAVRLAADADTAIDRERQRTRIIAAIGGIEIGITEPPRRPELPAAAVEDRKDSAMPQPTPNMPQPTPNVPRTANTPASAVSTTPPPHSGLELPLIGTVPFTDTAARFLRPLVPSFVANAIDTATHPLRTARQAFEEVEEVTFTLRRTRKVTIDGSTLQSPQTDAALGHQPRDGSPEAAHAQHVAATIVDSDRSAHWGAGHSALPPTGAAGYAIPAPTRPNQLSGSRYPQLPGSNRRELPPGT
ncbi:DUF4407 domain-containing protein [Nocardia sp. CNY236]|uniref:DUF4407 domain-containing protein n=1 Tax=Nocardia sp. CNY236 TaxID=1169152 RepID=UPI0004125308|nr:DUF4407 domain-containing protein [Nocardia sp. CNY236]